MKREIECPEVFVDDPHSGTTCKYVNMFIHNFLHVHVGAAEFL